jgi:spore maturation protein CgeB
MPERCFGVPACGGFLLSDARKHASQSFIPGVEWVDFSDLEECIDKIKYYLANFPASRAIAEAAHARLVREHSYVHRAKTLVAAAKAWRGCFSVACAGVE